MSLPYEEQATAAIAQFAAKTELSLLDWNHLKVVSQIQIQLIEYEAQSRNMSFEELIAEAHDSTRLARHMAADGDPRPHSLCDCHAIIAGKDPRALSLRGILAWHKMRIDFPHNGVWLPRNTAAKAQMPATLKNAVPHSRIHRNWYYRWLDEVISFQTIDNAQTLSSKLREVARKLQTGTFPPKVMLRAHESPNDL